MMYLILILTAISWSAVGFSIGVTIERDKALRRKQSMSTKEVMEANREMYGWRKNA